jgi:hypothetical protein
MLKRILFFATITLLTFPSTGFAQQDSQTLKSMGKVKFSGGYLDNKFSVSQDGKKLAYISVTTKGISKLHIRPLPSGKEKLYDITKITDDPHDLFFAPGGNYVVILLKTGNLKTVHFVDLKTGKFSKLTGFTKCTLRKGKTGLEIITLKFNQTKNAQIYLVNIFSIKNLRKPVKKYRLSGDVRGRVEKPEKMDISYFSKDFLKVTVKIVGIYDKKSDSKHPDTHGVYDFTTKKLTKFDAVSNNAKWELEAGLFLKHKGQAYVLQLSGMQTVKGIQGKFRIGNGINKWKNIKPKFKIGRFDFSSLSYKKRKANKNSLKFALVIDPQNPVTLLRKKSEPRFLHFFELNPKTLEAVDLGKVSIKNNYYSWSKGKNVIAVMKLSKNWQVGSFEIELYKIK